MSHKHTTEAYFIVDLSLGQSTVQSEKFSVKASAIQVLEFTENICTGEERFKEGMIADVKCLEA